MIDWKIAFNNHHLQATDGQQIKSPKHLSHLNSIKSILMQNAHLNSSESKKSSHRNEIKTKKAAKK